MKENKYIYSDDVTINKAIEQIRNGMLADEVQAKFGLSGEDMDLIDFVISEF
ncbi:hypothetical protein [Pontibacillus salipaludis]|uniref:hypothetical protein n=1 Tax=Pontibacillus salipaludis TaxID=1697394 RepID=UPI0031F07BEB